MTWLKIDDKSAFHKKVAGAGNEAWGAVCRAGAWSAEHLTDGRVPWSVALAVAPRAVWARAFKAKLLDPVDESEFQIHDYLDWNPSREEVLRVRALRSESGRAGGMRKQAKRLAPAKQTLEQTASKAPSKTEAKIYPVPVPVPVKEEESAARLPELRPIEEQIRRYRIFDPLDAHAIAKTQAEKMISGGPRLAWVLTSIEVCAAKHEGQGLSALELQSRLVGYIRKSRAPDDEKAVRKFVESEPDKAPTPEEIAARDKASAERIAKLEAEKRRREERGIPLGGSK